MAKKRNPQPTNPIHPGEMLLEEFLLPAGRSQAGFAREIGWTRARLNEFIRGKRGVTAVAFGTLPEASRLGLDIREQRVQLSPLESRLVNSMRTRCWMLMPMGISAA